VRFAVRGEFEHPYPPTKLQFIPDATGAHADLLATSGDYLRVWSLDGSQHGGDGSQVAAGYRHIKLDNNQKSEFCAPLTSFDWNEAAPHLIGTASIDTTCTIWDINAQVATTQLIAHDKEVFDIAFARGTDVFGSCGADGSLRLFDLRSLEHSTILFEHSQPLLRLAWNKQDPNYLIAVAQDSNACFLLDVRVPSIPCAELLAHSAPVNGAVWAPHSSCHLCTAGEDGRAFIWDVSSLPNKVVDPMLGFSAEGPVSHLAWSSSQPEWLSVVFGSSLQVLRV
jgi:DDB1- and CUL4-associated factor 7